MLCWMCGVTRRGKIRNEMIRGTVKVAEISSKKQERRLNWHGHVMRKEEEYVGRRVMVMEIPGHRRKGDLNLDGKTDSKKMCGKRASILSRNSDPV